MTILVYDSLAVRLKSGRGAGSRLQEGAKRNSVRSEDGWWTC